MILFQKKKDNLELVEADLTKPDGWEDACKGVKWVLHTASPIGKEGMTDEQYASKALDGVSHVFDAPLKQGVKRVVFTSSVAAIFPNNYDKILNEEVWSDVKDVKGCVLSKLKAELAVWEIHKKAQGKIEVATVLPGGIFGPALSTLHRTTLMMFAAFFNNYPGVIEGDSPLSFIDVSSNSHLGSDY